MLRNITQKGCHTGESGLTLDELSGYDWAGVVSGDGGTGVNKLLVAVGLPLSQDESSECCTDG